MEYIEMSAAAVSKLISNDGSRIPFNANGAAPTGFRPMPVPLFSHGKALSSMGMFLLRHQALARTLEEEGERPHLSLRECR